MGEPSPRSLPPRLLLTRPHLHLTHIRSNPPSFSTFLFQRRFSTRDEGSFFYPQSPLTNPWLPL